MKAKFTTRQMVLCALFAALTAIGAFIKIPVPIVPFTLQFLFAILSGLLLGSRLGAASVGIYAILGLVGLPIFAEGGGFWYIFKPSFGYIIGFVFASYAAGKLLENRQKLTYSSLLLASFVGLIIVYGFGLAYYYLICNFIINTPMALGPLIIYGLVLAVPGDLCLCFLAAYLTKHIKPLLGKI